MASGGARGVTHIGPKETAVIYNRLNEILVKIADRVVAYPGGLDDQKLADELGVKKTAVARIRGTCFGDVTRNSGGRTRAELEKTIEQMAKTIDELVTTTRNLVTCHDEMVMKHDSLAMHLSVNRIADCRHLRIRQNHS